MRNEVKHFRKEQAGVMIMLKNWGDLDFHIVALRLSAVHSHHVAKVIYPKQYKHLKKPAQHNHLGRWKMEQFLAVLLVHHQVEPEILKNLAF